MGSPIDHENLGHWRGEDDEDKLDHDGTVHTGEY